MYKINTYQSLGMASDQMEEGEPIEVKVMRMVREKEPIKEGAPLIFTDRKEGVNAAYNIRTDRFEIAVDAMSRLLASKTAKRDEVPALEDSKFKDEKNSDGKAEPIQGTQQVNEPAK